MLDLEPRDGQVILDPQIPEEIRRVRLTGTNTVGERWDVEAIGTNAYVRLAAH